MTVGYFSNAACRYNSVQWQQKEIPYMLLVVSCVVVTLELLWIDAPHVECCFVWRLSLADGYTLFILPLINNNPC